MSNADALRQTPLKSYHLDHGATMTAFAGWEMPLHYGSITAEHVQCRESGAIFDVSHMGRVWVKGLHARRLLERACSRRVGDMVRGQCRYTLVCNESGGVLDDMLVYRLDEDEFLIVPNASNREKILAHLESIRELRGFKVSIDDRTDKTAMIAMQGPRVMDLIGQVSKEIPSLKRYRFAEKNMMVLKLVVSRTGYTGEDGVEVILPAGMVNLALKLLLQNVDAAAAEAALKPAGLGARDTLRVEAGMPLYGHELGEDINALECGVDFAIDLDKSEEADGETFVGQDALVRIRDGGGPARRLVGIACQGQRSPRQGMAVLAADGASGIVTSGCLSPTLGHPVALAFVPRELNDGTEVTIDPERTKLVGRVVPPAFYKRSKAGV